MLKQMVNLINIDSDAKIKPKFTDIEFFQLEIQRI